MKSNRDGGRSFAALRRTLRREGLSTTPPFSPAFHERLMDRVACEALPRPETERPRAPTPRSGVTRYRALAGGGIAALILASWVVVWFAGRHEGSSRRDGGPTSGRSPVTVADGSPAGGLLVSVETMPLYDDIDAELRAGAWTLAASLVELPDWANVADFDAASPQSPASRP